MITGSNLKTKKVIFVQLSAAFVVGGCILQLKGPAAIYYIGVVGS